MLGSNHQIKRGDFAGDISAKIVARSFVDDWLDLDMEFTEAIRKDWRLAETDVVLLRNIETQKCVMGKCVGFRKSMMGVQVSLRTHSGKLGDPGLSVGSIWRLNLVFRYVLRICILSLSSHLTEQA